MAEILKNATRDSLLILDEIGRGTSTYDGMSIARAVIEYIANKKKLGAKTLFATHYHELTVLEDSLIGVKNFNIACRKRGEDIIFLRKIVPGGADESYGIEVSKLAGIRMRSSSGPSRFSRRWKKELRLSSAAAASLGWRRNSSPSRRLKEAWWKSSWESLMWIASLQERRFNGLYELKAMLKK